MDTNYDDFYTDLINIWKSGGDNGGEGGWAGYYYGVFSDIINENNFKNCAEIGIGYGFHAKQILDTCDVSMLYLIDPMVYYPNDGFATDVMKYGGFEKLVPNEGLVFFYKGNTYKLTGTFAPLNQILGIFKFGR